VFIVSVVVLVSSDLSLLLQAERINAIANKFIKQIRGDHDFFLSIKFDLVKNIYRFIYFKENATTH
jgi:hypothetical protein